MMVFCDEHKPSQAAEMNGDELQLSVMASATSYLSVPACIERNFVFKGPVRDFFALYLHTFPQIAGSTTPTAGITKT